MKRVVLVIALISLVLVKESISAGCRSMVPPHGKPNPYPINDITGKDSSNMNFLFAIENCKAYQVTVPNDGGNTTSSFYVIHVWGTPYEMGYAQGQAFKRLNTTDFIAKAWSYMKSSFESGLPMEFPPWLNELVATMGLDAALDLTQAATYEYTTSTIYETLRGVADGSGMDYDTLVKVHMVAGLTQGHCSAIGAWGSALADPHGLLQLRALDWDMDGPYRDYSAITVYHPTNDGHAYANIGFTSLIGAVTGISSSKLAISEIGVGYPDASFGDQSRIGLPFIFLLRDILAYDNTVDDAINRMAHARRTCDLILGVGDGNLMQFKGMQYSYSVLNIFDDKNMMPFNSTWHPRINDIVYWGMDWICPSYNIALSTLLRQYHGQITPELALRYISPIEQSGDNHLVYYDLGNMAIYVAFAAPFQVGGPVPAYDRQYTKLDANALFAEQPPTDL